MEREVRERFERIEALLRAGVERDNQTHAQFKERMELSEKRLERAEQRMEHAEQRMEHAEQRMEKFDRRLEAMRKLVEAGMKIVTRMGQRQQAMEEAIRDLAKSQKAFLDSLRKGGNGSRHAG
jgi:CII-binding regulator of phage lambda lysogenization HflD